MTSGAARSLLPRFDVWATALRDDPYPQYRALREAGGVARVGPGEYAVADYARVVELLSDPRLANELPAVYHSAAGGDGTFADFASRVMLYLDGPEHRSLRRLMAKHLSSARIRALQPLIRRRTREVIESAPRSGMEVISALALPIPVSVICDLLGIEVGEIDAIAPHAVALGRGLSGAADAVVAADEATVWLRRYITQQLQHAPAGSAMREIRDHAAVEAISAEAVTDNLLFLFFAGFETTTSVLGTAVAALAAHPNLAHQLRTGALSMSFAVDEFLRYEAPIQSRVRMVTDSLELGGRVLRPGRIVILLLGSANRDPAIFEAPDQLRLDRRPNPHVSFGGGPHLCLGAHIARLEAQVVLSTLLEETTQLRALEAPTWDNESAFRSLRTLNVELR